MKVYLKVDSENVIRDCITYPYGDYVEHEVAEIPQGINGGWFKLENGVVVEYPELKPKDESDEILELKANQAVMQKALDDLLLVGGAI